MGLGRPIKRTASTPTVPPITRNPTPKQQVFNIVCTGLKPNSAHTFFYENVDRSQDCIPVYPKPASPTSVTLGSPLITDASGKIEFNFHFTINVETQVDAINKVRYELAGDKKFELRTLDSSASKVVPFQNYSAINTFNLNINLANLNITGLTSFQSSGLF